MAPRVYSSVREALNGVLSGSARRVSCSHIDSTSSSHKSTTATEEDEDYDTPVDNTNSYNGDCTVFVRLADENDDDNEEVDITNLSEEDLRKLKRTDPFLYYSIPAIRRRDGFGNVSELVRNGGRRVTSRRSSLPAELLASADVSRSNQRNKSRTLQVQEELPEEQEAEEDDEEPGVKRRRSSITVRRNRRVSAEAYPTLLCEDIMRELHGLDSSNSDNDDVFDALDLGEVNDHDEDEDDDLLMDADELKALKDELFG